ncbi:MAG: hypothetical protein GY939_08010 [Actinomycetia bacterium]|nr:hypothetical protein [Actinomycetes bacterium]
MTTLYYDPHLNVHHRLPVQSALTTSYYAAPQAPEDARRLFEAGIASMGLDSAPKLPLRPGRGYGASLILAREWEMVELEARLAHAIEESYEPTWDRATGEFTWGMGLDEQHPRGQFNAFLAAAEAAGPGRWTDLSTAPLALCPQIVDVDFPTVALKRAEWVNGCLLLSVAPLKEDPSVFTTFRLIDVEPRQWYLTGIDGATTDTRPDTLVFRVPLIAGDLELVPGAY